jgi:hypothetical protein
LGVVNASTATTIATFVRIVNATQTTQLLQWNLESVDRVLAWVDAIEALVNRYIDAHRAHDLDAILAQLFDRASFPAAVAPSG